MLDDTFNNFVANPGTLTVSRHDACAAEPLTILEQSMSRSEFNGVPVLIIDPDQVPQDREGFKAYMMDRLPRKIYERKRMLEYAMGFYEDALEDSTKNECPFGLMLPAAVIYPAMRRQDLLHIVIAPGAMSTPEWYLLFSSGTQRANNQPLLDDLQSWRFFGLHHELAHVTGAHEPQADHIASLFCRQAFPDSVAPWIQADQRALEAVLVATQLATYTNECAEFQDDARDTIQRYGWQMVVANDRANIIPQDEVEAMTHANILARRFDHYDKDDHRLITLGAIVRDAGLADQILSPETHGITQGARKLESKITTLTQDPEIHQMARRFALAARRIHKGREAYAGPKPR